MGKAVEGWCVKSWIIVLCFGSSKTLFLRCLLVNKAVYMDIRDPRRVCVPSSRDGRRVISHKKWVAGVLALMVLGIKHMLCARFWGK